MPQAPTIGSLCIGGDWAIAHGDFETLGYVARQLSTYVPEPLHCRLVDLAAACNHDAQRANQLWDEVKSQLFR